MTFQTAYTPVLAELPLDTPLPLIELEAAHWIARFTTVPSQPGRALELELSGGVSDEWVLPALERFLQGLPRLVGSVRVTGAASENARAIVACHG